ncbi:MAG: hypothetical protein LBH69_05535, partial [Methanomassiliicoccaceae archaeon]|nr:hypothetical protein [Methanomassiliicoccaceae archaeon]
MQRARFAVSMIIAFAMLFAPYMMFIPSASENGQQTLGAPEDVSTPEALIAAVAAGQNLIVITDNITLTDDSILRITSGRDITIQSEEGKRYTILFKDDTRLVQEGGRLTLRDINVVQDAAHVRDGSDPTYHWFMISGSSTVLSVYDCTIESKLTYISYSSTGLITRNSGTPTMYIEDSTLISSQRAVYGMSAGLVCYLTNTTILCNRDVLYRGDFIIQGTTTFGNTYSADAYLYDFRGISVKGPSAPGEFAEFEKTGPGAFVGSPDYKIYYSLIPGSFTSVSATEYTSPVPIANDTTFYVAVGHTKNAKTYFSTPAEIECVFGMTGITALEKLGHAYAYAAAIDPLPYTGGSYAVLAAALGTALGLLNGPGAADEVYLAAAADIAAAIAQLEVSSEYGVGTAEELLAAVTAGRGLIVLTADIVMTGSMSPGVSSTADVTIQSPVSKNYTITFKDSTRLEVRGKLTLRDINVIMDASNTGAQCIAVNTAGAVLRIYGCTIESERILSGSTGLINSTTSSLTYVYIEDSTIVSNQRALYGSSSDSVFSLTDTTVICPSAGVAFYRGSFIVNGSTVFSSNSSDAFVYDFRNASAKGPSLPGQYAEFEKTGTGANDPDYKIYYTDAPGEFTTASAAEYTVPIAITEDTMFYVAIGLTQNSRTFFGAPAEIGCRYMPPGSQAYEDLKQAYYDALDIDPTPYTEESYNVLAIAIGNAWDLLNDPSAGDPAYIAATDDIRTAAEQLEVAEGVRVGTPGELIAAVAAGHELIVLTDDIALTGTANLMISPAMDVTVKSAKNQQYTLLFKDDTRLTVDGGKLTLRNVNVVQDVTHIRDGVASADYSNPWFPISGSTARLYIENCTIESRLNYVNSMGLITCTGGSPIAYIEDSVLRSSQRVVYGWGAGMVCYITDSSLTAPREALHRVDLVLMGTTTIGGPITSETYLYDLRGVAVTGPVLPDDIVEFGKTGTGTNVNNPNCKIYYRLVPGDFTVSNVTEYVSPILLTEDTKFYVALGYTMNAKTYFGTPAEFDCKYMPSGSQAYAELKHAYLFALTYDPEIYTEQSFSVLAQAVGNAWDLLNDPDAGDPAYIAAKNDITDAIAQLCYEADTIYAKLADAIRDADAAGRTAWDYTPISFAAYQRALSDARSLTHEDSRDAHKYAYNSLNASIEALRPSSSVPVFTVDNPYAGVDFDVYNGYKANFHTHTSNSDGSGNPTTVSNQYLAAGYTFLAITDHNWVSYSGTAYPNGMFSIIGNELGRRTNDILSLFTDFYDTVGHTPGTVPNVSPNGGGNDHYGTPYGTTELTVLAYATAYDGGKGRFILPHPGRTIEFNPGVWNAGQNVEGSLKWFLRLFDTYPTLLGIEIVNYTDRHPDDRAVWDAMLTQSMPDRPIWGFGGDDNHGGAVGYSVNLFMLPPEVADMSPEDASAALKDAMDKGQFFVYSYASIGPNAGQETGSDWTYNRNGPVPTVTDITVDEQGGTITIKAINYDRIEWISANGVIVGTGEVIDLTSPGVDLYVRAVLTVNENEPYACQTFTQPFGLRPADPMPDHTVTLPSGEGYTVTPDSDYAQTMPHGGSFTFTVDPDQGYNVSSLVVKANGHVIEAAAGIYTVTVYTDIAITVEGIAKNVYSVTLTLGTGYTLSGNATAEHGSAYSFTLSVDPAYGDSVPVVKANGNEIFASGGVYTITAIEDIVITVEGLAINAHSVTLTPGTGHALSGDAAAGHESAYSFTLTLDPAYD